MTSTAELLLEAQLQQAGIPFEREYEFARLSLGRKWRFDFILKGFRRLIAIEVEGGTWTAGRHTRGKGFAADLEKYNAATELGWQVYRYSTAQVNDGSALEQIRRILSMKEDSTRDAA